jgi:hypothetical protein
VIEVVVEVVVDVAAGFGDGAVVAGGADVVVGARLVVVGPTVLTTSGPDDPALGCSSEQAPSARTTAAAIHTLLDISRS